MNQNRRENVLFKVCKTSFVNFVHFFYIFCCYKHYAHYYYYHFSFFFLNNKNIFKKAGRGGRHILIPHLENIVDICLGIFMPIKTTSKCHRQNTFRHGQLIFIKEVGYSITSLYSDKDYAVISNL